MTEPLLWSPEKRSHHKREASTPQPESNSCSPQLEKARVQQRRPSVAKNKNVNNSFKRRKKKKKKEEDTSRQSPCVCYQCFINVITMN